jgi:hypothetical protein
MQENEIMYTRSNGEQVPIKSLNTEHILNSLSKEYREIFNSQNKSEFSEHLKKIDMLKNEYYTRLNKFNEELGE